MRELENHPQCSYSSPLEQVFTGILDTDFTVSDWRRFIALLILSTSIPTYCKYYNEYADSGISAYDVNSPVT
jgi:hypothetical protein